MEGCSGSHGDIVRRSPRISVQTKHTAADKMTVNSRRAKLRLPVPAAAPPHESESDKDDPADVDFAPGGINEDVDLEAEGTNRKRCRTHARGDAPGNAGEGNTSSYTSIRCSPGKFCKLVAALPSDLKQRVRENNFGGLLDFKPTELDRQLLSWLMRKLNPETMSLELPGNQSIQITAHSVWCIFQIPNKGQAPVRLSEAHLNVRRKALAAEIYGKESNIISPADIMGFLESRHITGDIGLRAFFMCAFQSLLFPNTDWKIRLVDVMYTEDMANIGNMNWCKEVVDDLSKSSRLYKKAFKEKGLSAPIRGCGIFLVLLYVDFLQHGFDIPPYTLPRCAQFDSKMINEIARADLRGDVPPGTIEFGNLRIKDVIDTCYTVPSVGPAVTLITASQPPPEFQPGTSAPTGTSCHGSGTSHDPGGEIAFNLRPPVVCTYPSLSAAFGQSIVDVVGRSRKSMALKILADFDSSAKEAQSFMAKAVECTNSAVQFANKAVELTTRSSSLMEKAHHQCFSSIQKLLVDARAEKLAANEARRGRQRTGRSQGPQIYGASETVTPLPEDSDQQGPATADETFQEPAQDPYQHGAQGAHPGQHCDSLEVEHLEMHTNDYMGPGGGDEYTKGFCNASIPKDTSHGSHHSSPRSEGNDGAPNKAISTPPHLRSPAHGVDSILSKLISTYIVDPTHSCQEDQSNNLPDDYFHDARPNEQISDRQIVVVNSDHVVVDKFTIHESTSHQQVPIHEEFFHDDIGHATPATAAQGTSADETTKWDVTPVTVHVIDSSPQVPSHEDATHGHTVIWDLTPQNFASTGAVHQASTQGGDSYSHRVRWDETPTIAQHASSAHPHTSDEEILIADTFGRIFPNELPHNQTRIPMQGVIHSTEPSIDNSVDGDTINKDVVGVIPGDVPNQEDITAFTPLFKSPTNHEQAIKENAVHTYSRRITRSTILAEAKKAKQLEDDPEAKKAKQLEDKAAKEEKRLQTQRKREAAAAAKQEKMLQARMKKQQKELEAAMKKEQKDMQAAMKKAETDKKKGATKRTAAAKQMQPAKNKKQKVLISKDEEAKRAAHSEMLVQLRQHAEEEIDKLRSNVFVQAGPKAPVVLSQEPFPEDPIDDFNAQTSPIRLSQEERQSTSANFSTFQKMLYKKVGAKLRKNKRKYISPFQLPGSRPRVPLERALALRHKIQSDHELRQAILIDFSIFTCFTGEDLLSSCDDDQYGDSSLLDYIAHCLQFDDIVHKEDSIGYRLFFSTSLWQSLKDVDKVFKDDGITETDEFRRLFLHLEDQSEHYDLTAAKLIFMPACSGQHYFVYCINMIHNRIDILDSIDYWWADTNPEIRHKPIWDKLPILNAAFQKVTMNKFPSFETWIPKFADVTKQGGPKDCMFFIWKYLEFWDGESLKTDINPFKGSIYRVELMHYSVFHAINQADLPDKLDVFRIGGRKMELSESQ